ncbi:MAG: hypothetical protein LC797_00960 [Chloroflexi bacterium]|nr:hypothetical protein [Chloroflexota bacterium]
MGVAGPSHKPNGTYHAAEVQRERTRRTRLLIVIGGFLAMVGLVNVALVNADMTRIERQGPERLALAGGGIDHFVPSILSNLQRAQQSANTVSLVLADDPRHSLPFVEDKRALERWLALSGLSLAALFIGMENTIPTSTAHARQPTGTDLSRLLILLALAYGSLSIFESG